MTCPSIFMTLLTCFFKHSLSASFASPAFPAGILSSQSVHSGSARAHAAPLPKQQILTTVSTMAIKKMAGGLVMEPTLLLEISGCAERDHP